MHPPQTSAQARRWASTSVADHPPSAAAARSSAGTRPWVSAVMRAGAAARRGSSCSGVSGVSYTGAMLADSGVLFKLARLALALGRLLGQVVPRIGVELRH